LAADVDDISLSPAEPANLKKKHPQ
jgi:hypothetical protein